MIKQIEEILGDEAESLLTHQSKTIPKEKLHLPGPDFLDRTVPFGSLAGRAAQPASLFDHGRFAGTGYLSILPVDQGIEHSAGASFAPNPDYFDPENIVKLAIEGGCNAVASTLGVLGSVSRKYAHKIPFIVKINHNEFFTYPNSFDQICSASMDQAFDQGCVGVGATIYFGSDESKRQIRKSAALLPTRTNLGCSLCCGATFATRHSSQRRRLSHFRRFDRSGQSPGRDHRSRHHQTEDADQQRRLQSDHK